MILELDELPDGLLDVSAKEIARVCSQPTLIHLEGARQPAVFVSILLHGNEDVGLLAIQQVLKAYRDRPLPRCLSLFIGNVEACAASARYLPHQVDFNRAWPGSELPISPTHNMLSAVTDRILERGVFVSVDLHNNTGLNPLYSCVCSPSPEHIYLARLFSRTIVYFTRPRGVQTQAFSPYCPSVTCECGQIGNAAGVLRAAELIEACLHLFEFPDHQLPTGDVDLYHTVARIKIRENCSFGFSPGSDLVLRADLDSLNFVELQAGERLGTLNAKLEDCFAVNDSEGRDVTHAYLACSRRQLQLGRAAMPSMFTCNLDVIRQDCLGYLMERMSLSR